MRLTTEPNRRVQDGLKEHWLCSECETRLGKFEKDFADRIFHVGDLKPETVKYERWFSLFATSLAWRTLTYAYGRSGNAEYSATQIARVSAARTAWCDVLLGKKSASARFPQHVINFQRSNSTTIPDLPTNWNRFQLRQITLDIVGSSSNLMTYTKLGPFTFLGMIQYQKQEWEGTRIKNFGGTFPPRKVVMPGSILALFREKAELSQKAMDTVSDKQKGVIESEFERRLARSGNDRQLEAILADYELFGPDK